MVVLLACLRWGCAGLASDYPEDIQAAMPPFTRKEKVRGAILAGLFLLSLLAVVFFASWMWIHDDPSRGFLSAYGMALASMAVACLLDILIVDWLIICLWRPNWVVIPDTEDCTGWGDYRFHVKAQFTPAALIALFAIPAVLAGIATWIN